MSKHDFPPMQNDSILRAAKGEPVDRVPVWIMRQAGRYLPEFRKVREAYDFFTVCQTPTLACEVTLQPLQRFDLDASIIFSDILVIPQAMGMYIEMVPGKGPVIVSPLTGPEDLERLKRPNVEEDLKYVAEAITLTRHKIGGKVPLIGFSGSAWTLMAYMIQGSGDVTLAKPRSWLYKYKEASHKLLTLLTDIIIDYLVMQVKAGAQLLDVFESFANFLNDELFKEYVLPYLKRISTSVREKLKEAGIPAVPMIAFCKGATMNSLEMLAKSQCFEILSLDWKIDPVEAKSRLGPYVILQGNLDPCALYGDKEQVFKLTQNMVRAFGKHRYIANLGHGILPDIPISIVETFIDAVHSA